jgi:hypothetical protein
MLWFPGLQSILVKTLEMVSFWNGELSNMEKEMVQERGDLGVSFFDFLDIDEETQAILFLTRAQAMTDTAFVGILHKELIRGQGWQRTRSTLMRLGFAAGYSDCQFLRKAYAWRDDDHLLRAGIALHSFKGIARTRLARIDADRTEGRSSGLHRRQCAGSTWDT